MKKRLLAALLCALLIAALIPGAVWSAADPDEDPGVGDAPAPSEEPGGHVHAEHLYYIPPAKPTCMSEGHIGYYICECGKWFYDAEGTDTILSQNLVVLPKAEHTPEIVLDKPATCTEDGRTAGFLCRICGAEVPGYAAPQVVPAKGHSPSERWSSDASGHWHACTVCGEKLDFAAHVSGGAATETEPETCTVCGYVIHPAEGGDSPSPSPTHYPAPTPTGTVHPTERPTPTPEPSPEPTPTPEPGALPVTRIRFRDTGDTQMDELTEQQPDEDTPLCTMQLPWQRPESAGWYFEGWRCSADGALYQPGDELSFRYADTPQIDMTAEWTVLIGRGNYDLTAGMRYRFGEGTYLLDGDSTTYYGGSAFYVRETGNYTIR